MKLSCAEAASICTKTEYKEAGLKEKIKLRLHLYFCKTCKDYYHNNRRLTGLLKKAYIKPCSSLEKERLKEKIRNGASQASQQQKKQ